MMITKNTYFASLTVALALTLSACSHTTPKSEVTPDATTVAAEKSFVDRAIASPPGEAALVKVVSQALVGTSDEAHFLQEAQRFLSTDERLTMSNVARKFTDEQGLAFLKEFKLRNASVFRSGAMEEIGARIDNAISERVHAGNLESRSTVSTGMRLTDAPELVTSVRRANQINPELGQKVVHIYQLTKYSAIDGVTCTTVAHFSSSSLTNTTKFYGELSNIADRLPAVADKTGCMIRNAGAYLVNFTANVTHAASPFIAASGLSQHCHIPPKVEAEVAKFQTEYERTGQMPEVDYTCRGY